MPQRTLLIVCALLGALAAVPAARAEPAAPQTPPPSFVPRQVIVQWAPGAEPAEKVEARAEAEVEFRANLGDPRFQLVEVESGQAVMAAIEELAGDPAVAVAERDSYSAPTSVPNDPLFGQEWGLENLGAGIGGFSGAIAGADISAPGAWDRTVGTPSVVVADIDTGYRFDSPDLGPVAWVNPGEIPSNGIDDDNNGFIDDVHGYDFVGPNSESPSQDADPTDDNVISGGHGVHTAGTIGAAGDNGVGITGVAQNVRIMPLRVCANAPKLSEARCPTSSIIAAINYAGANGARVANLSLGGTVKSTAELNAFAENPQTLYVIAAGNDGQDNDSVGHYPCDYEPESTAIGGAIDNIVCVAATDQADELASFSDWGEESVDLAAPGTEILSTFPTTEALFEEGFEQNDFATKWTATGVNGGLARTNEAPLTSFGISDSPGATPVANSGHSSTLSSPIPVPPGYGACRFSGQGFVSLGGGTATLIIFKNGLSAFTFQLPNTGGTAMESFTTAPMNGLAESTVGVRLRYTAGPSPTASSGAWFDDLKLTCNAPVSTPPGYAYLQGTSMAAPHVSGAAALLFSLEPASTIAKVRRALLMGVDSDPSLTGKTSSGGRLDVAKAMERLADHEAPAAPSLTSTSPESPANENDPKIVGSAEADSTVDIYSGASCSGVPVATGSAAELSSQGIAVHVFDDSLNQFSATATDAALNVSACSVPISYKEKSALPPAPTLSSTLPPSPANENHPKVVGSAEAGLTVDIYAGGFCGGTPIGSGTAAELSSPGIAVTVADDSVNQLSATATETVGTSPCSSAISYTEDSTAPAAPVLSSTIPASPADNRNPKIVGSAEAESEIRLYRGSECGSSPLAYGSAAQLSAPGFGVEVGAETTTQFSATATDAAENTSTCSSPISYTNTEPFVTHSAQIIEPVADGPPAPAPSCKVPKLAGKTLAQAKAALKGASCSLGKVTKPKPRKGQKLGVLVVKSSSPGPGASAAGAVALKLGPKPKKRPH